MRRAIKILVSLGILTATTAGITGLICCDAFQQRLLIYVLNQKGFKASADHLSVGIFTKGITARSVSFSRDGNTFTIEKFCAKQECFLGFLPSRLALNEIEIEGEIKYGKFTISAGTQKPEETTNISEVPLKNNFIRRNGDSSVALSGKISKEAEGDILDFSIDGNVKKEFNPTLDNLPELHVVAFFSDAKTTSRGNATITNAQDNQSVKIEMLYGNAEKTSTMSGELNFNNGKIDGNASLTLVHPGTSFYPELKLVKGIANLKISKNFPAQKFAIENNFSLTVSEIASLIPELDAFPDLQLNGCAKFDISPSSLFLHAANASVNAICSDGNTSNVAFLETTPLSFERNDFGIWQVAGNDLKAFVKFSGTPLAVLNPFIGNFSFSSGEISGQLTLLFNESENLLREKSPTSLDKIEIKNVVLQKNQSTLLKNLSGTFYPRATWNGNTVSAAISDGEIVVETYKLPNKKLSVKINGNAKLDAEKIAISSVRINVSDGVESANELFTISTENAQLTRGEILTDFEKYPIKVCAVKLPLPLLNPPQDGPDIQFFGTLAGTVFVQPNKSGVKFFSDGNGISIENFKMLGNGGKTLFQNLSLKSNNTSVTVEQKADKQFETTISIEKAHLRDEDQEIATGNLKIGIGSEISSIAGNLTGTLAGICKQPALSVFSNIAGGTYSAKGNFDIGTTSGNISLRVENIRFCVPGSEIIKSASLNLYAPTGGFEKSTDVARVLASINDNSELRIKFSELNNISFSEKPGVKFNAQALIPLADYKDFLPLFIFLSESKNGKKENSEQISAENSEQKIRGTSWENFHGSLTFKINELRIPENTFHDISGKIESSEKALEILANTESFFDGNARSKIKFTKGKSGRMVNFDCGVIVKNSELSKIIHVMYGNTSPIDGKFNLNLRVNSFWEDEESMLKNISAKVILESKNGSIKAFSAENKTLKIAGELTSIGGDFAGIVGGLTRKASPKLSKLATGAQTLQKYFSDFPYDDLKLVANYKFGSPINVGEIILRNDIVNFVGAGTITPIDDTKIGDWPVKASAELRMRGELGEVIELLKLTDGNVDSNGFVRVPKIDFTGTLNNTSNNLFETLYKSAELPNSQYEEIFP